MDALPVTGGFFLTTLAPLVGGFPSTHRLSPVAGLSFPGGALVESELSLTSGLPLPIGVAFDVSPAVTSRLGDRLPRWRIW